MAVMRLLRTLKPSPSPSFVVASLALVAALSGTAYAAGVLPVHSVGTPQLKAGAVTSAKIKDGTVKTRDLAAGVIATTTDTSMMLARINGIPSTFDVPVSYGAPAGTSTANASPDAVSMVSPGVAATASDLVVGLTVPVSNNSDRRFTLMVNGAESALTCTVPANGSTCVSTGTAAIPAGADIVIRADHTAAFNSQATEARVSFVMTSS